MVTFGASKVTGSYCADALRCAQELLQSLAAWQACRAAADLPLVSDLALTPER